MFVLFTRERPPSPSPPPTTRLTHLAVTVGAGWLALQRPGLPLQPEEAAVEAAPGVVTAGRVAAGGTTGPGLQ